MQQKMRQAAALFAAGSTLFTAIPAEGGGPVVEGARVRHGRAKFERDGDTLRIRSGRLTVIDYTRFDVPVGTSVEFLQADGKSRILNRISSDAPSMIMGSMMSNGRVYFINRAGVIFGASSTVNVGGLFAAAGNMSTQDFKAGRDRVTGMQGAVRNEGTIHAQSEVVLAGRTVVNNGQIEAGQGGLVAMVSGDSVSVRRTGSNVSVRVSGGMQDMGVPGIQNTGSISTKGGRIVATAGDLASLAVDMQGSVVAKAVEIDGGANGGVRLAGTVDASSASNGGTQGGTVKVTGRTVDLASTAAIDASGSRQGGTVNVGGGVQGGDPNVRNAQTLNVAQGATVNADATQAGAGGTISFWSEGTTTYRGSASARGAGQNGNGGFVEVSGKTHLDFDGASTVQGAGLGRTGTLLLDPGFLIVQNAAGGADTISIGQLNTLLSANNVVLQNSGVSQDSGIQWNATNAISGPNANSITLNAVGAGATVEVTAAPNFGTWTGDFNLNAAAGGINIGAAISRPNGGNISMTAGAGQFIALNNATLSTLSGNISLNSPVLLGTNVSVSAGSGNVLFGGTVAGSGGNRNLTVNSTGATTFAGSLSSLGALTTNAGGTVSFGGDISASGNISVGEAATFTAGAHTIGNTGAFSTVFNGTVGGPGSLTINNGTGAVQFKDAVGGNPLAALTVNSSGSVLFSQTVDGGMPLVINTAGTTTFNGAVGAGTALSSVQMVGGTAVVSGGSVTTTGTQTWNALQLGASGIFNASAMTVNGTLTRSGAGNRDLTINSPGAVLLGGTVTNLRNITTDAGGTLTLGANVTASGAVTVNDQMVLGAPSVVINAGSMDLQGVTGAGNSLQLVSLNTVNLNGNLTGLQNFSTDSNGTTVLNADLSASGTVTLADAFVAGGLGATRTVTSTGGAISFNKTVNGPASLVVNGSASPVTFNGAIGGTTALGGLNVQSVGDVTFVNTINGAMDLVVDTAGTTKFQNTVGATTALNSVDVSGLVNFSGASVRTTGGQDYGNATVGTSTTLTSTGSGDIHLHGTLASPLAKALTVNTAGNTIFDGTVSGLSTLTTDAGGTNQFNADVSTTSTITLAGTSIFNGAGRIMASNAGAINFNGPVQLNTGLTVNTPGTTKFASGVTSPGANTWLTVSGPVNFSGPSVTTTGDQSYGAATLNSDVTLAATNGGNISFLSTLNGTKNLVINTAGTTTFGGAVGNVNRLQSLLVSGPTVINGGSVRTNLNQDYGNLTLGANTTLTANTNGNISFNGTVGSTAGQNLVVNTGGVTGFFGTVNGIGSLTTDAAGSNTVAGDITANLAVLLNGPTNLSGAARTIASNTSTVTFGGTLNGATDLTVTAAGNTVFNGTVGNSTALSSLTVTGNTFMNTGTVRTTGSQLYGGSFGLGTNTVLTSLAGGNIQFNSNVDGARTLTTSTTGAGASIFNGQVGGLGPLAALTVNGAAQLNGVVFRTSGAQTYNGATTLGNTTNIQTPGGAVTFNGTVDGASALSVSTTGTTAFNGLVGGQNALASILVFGNTTFSGGGATTIGSQYYGPTSIVGDTTLTSTGGGSMFFFSTINGASALNISSTGTTTLTGAVGGINALTQFVVGGPVNINGGSVTTTGDQLYGNAVLGGTTTLTSTAGGDVTMAGTVNGLGVNALTVNTAGQTAFQGNVSNVTSLTTDNAGTNQIDADLTLSNSILLGGNTLLGAGTHSMTTTTGGITFDGMLDGPGGLDLNPGTVATFNGAVGSSTPLASLMLNGPAVVNGGQMHVAGDLTFNDVATFNANTAVTAGGTLSLNANALAGAFDLSLAGGQLAFADNIMVQGNNLTLTGTANAAGALDLDAAGQLGIYGSLYTAGALNMHTPTLLVLSGAIDSLGDLFFNSAIRVEGDSQITSRDGGNVIFASTINGTNFEADSLYVRCSGLTAFNADVGNTMRMWKLETDRPGTVQVAPSANAVIVIYGELDRGPDTGGGVALAQAYSSMWEATAALLRDGRRAAMVDYNRALTDILSDDLLEELRSPGIARADLHF